MAHFSLFVRLAMACIGTDLSDAVKAHESHLASITSLHVKCDLCEGTAGSEQGTVLLSRECWRKGKLEKELVATEKITGPDGTVRDVSGTNRFRISSVSLTDARSSVNWDPSNPPAQPLDPGRDMKEFSSIKCGITMRDPKQPCGMTWSLLLLEPVPGQALAEFVASSKVRMTEWSDDNVTLTVDASDVSNMKDAVIELSPRHGFLIRRIAYNFGMVALVEKFEAVDGVWAPMVVRREMGADVTVARVTKMDVNKAIPESELVAFFPAGARVDEPDKGIIHIWGTDGPQLSFKNYDQFMEYIDQSMRKAAKTGGYVVPVAPKSRSFGWFYVANAVALALLVASRKWLTRK